MDELELTLDKLDDVPESMRGLYAEQDGKFRLKVKGVEDTSGLKSALEKERRDRSAFEKQVKAWQTLGRKPEEVADLIKEREAQEHADAEKKGEWDKLKAQMNEKHAVDLKAKDDELAKMRMAIERHLIDASATRAIADAKGVPTLLLPHVRSSVKVIEENGEFQVRVVDAKGDPRVNGKGDPLGISDLVGEMRQSDVFGRAFEGSGKTGSGMQPNSTAGGPGRNDDLSKLSPMARIAKHREAQSGASQRT